MLILILIIAILLIVLNTYVWDSEGLAILCEFMMVGSVIAILIIACLLSGSMVIDKKIEMYSSENNSIQTEITTIIESYKQFESNTFKDIKTTSPVTLVTMFPELKSNELVNKQIEVYIENNKQIKSLKTEKIDTKIYKWWLYFGG